MDEENVKRKKLEDAAWYQSDFGAQLTKGKKGAKDDFLAPEDIYLQVGRRPQVQNSE